MTIHKPHFQQKDRVGAVLLIRKDGSALMQLRDVKKSLRNSGKWVPPGGHADPGEDMSVCARRELLEETAYDCSDLQFLTEFEDYVKGWPPYILTVFWALYDEVQKTECLEGQDLKFIRRDLYDEYDIPQYLLSVWDKAISVSKKKRNAFNF